MANVISTKRVAIVKANAQMVIVVSIASFITIFCLVAAKAVFSQTQYQARVTTAKQKAHSQLQQNITAFNSLASSYGQFEAKNPNIIGGTNSGSGNNNGDNATIILDALPDSYDFPALTSSVEKILTDRGFHVTNIAGTDDQLAQQTNVSSPSPEPVSMPFSFTVDDSSYTAIGQLLAALQQSIRPIQVDTINLSGSNSNMTMTVDAHTYYQPAKSVSISQKVVK